MAALFKNKGTLNRKKHGLNCLYLNEVCPVKLFIMMMLATCNPSKSLTDFSLSNSSRK